MTRFQNPPALLGLAQDMILKGWQPVWCPHRMSGSFSPEAGCTGGAPYPTVLPQPPVAHKLAFRPPPGVLVIDVDHYDGKHGMDTIDRAVAWLGELPETYRVTSRGYANPSGRYLFRIPEDLLVTDSSLYQFADPDDQRTDVEIVRTGHRFSWAPGDYHYKNDELINCWDCYGDVCDLPDVEEVPWLPEKWAAYFRNPPVPQKHEAYTRPSDGADWWLSQGDGSLGTDAELASFAYNMLLSRVPEEEIWEQWARVAVALDPGRPWERRDFDRHLGSRAQGKVAEVLARQDDETDWFAGTGADLDLIAQRTREGYESSQELRALIEPEMPVDQGVSRQLQEMINRPEAAEPTVAEQAEQAIKKNPKWDDLFYREAAKQVVTREVAKLWASEFQGYEGIGALPDPPDPALLQVTGKDNNATAVVSRESVTVLSGHRASGKTWICAAWAAQVIRAGGHVIWLDFERQPHGLSQKLRALEVPAHLTDAQLHYTSRLPGAERLAGDVAAYASGGRPVLFVVDAFRGLQNTVAPGSSANDGDAVEQVYLTYLNPACGAGATVALLDHMSKTGDAGTFGSERKESAADYVIKVEQSVPFTKRQPGFSSMTCSKDRYGVTAQGDPVGYLWVPGDKSKSGSSAEQYPFVPELRNWSPREAEDAAAVELSQKGQREIAVTTVVRDSPLAYGPRELGRQVFEVYPELFATAKAATDFASRMRGEGKLVKEPGTDGKYELPLPAVNGARVDMVNLLGEGN